MSSHPPLAPVMPGLPRASRVSRSLAETLRSWPAEQVAELLRLRPDLANPLPSDTSQLASRAASPASLSRAVDTLSTLELAVLDAVLTVTGDERSVVEAVHAERHSVEGAVQRLRASALVWGNDPVRVPAGVTEHLTASLGPTVATLLAGVGPQRIRQLLSDLGGPTSGDRAQDVDRAQKMLGDPSTLTSLLEDCSDNARHMLEHLDREGLVGTSDSAWPSISEARTPADELLARGLLLPAGGGSVRVPREVALGLRRGHTTHDPVPTPPPLSTRRRSVVLVDRAAGSAAWEFVQLVEACVGCVERSSVGVLRTGGLGIRELRTLAKKLQITEAAAALVLEAAASAGLLGNGANLELDDAWLPTPDYDVWLSRPPASRWAQLVTAWLASPRVPSLIGTTGPHRLRSCLGPDLERGWAAGLRRAALGELGGLGEGECLAPTRGDDAGIVATMRWRRPRRPRTSDASVLATLDQAGQMGLTGLGGLSTPARALLAEGGLAAAEKLAQILPSPATTVMIQADLTAVSRGPLEDTPQRLLNLLAETESRGAASVWRFSEVSIRRGFETGLSGADILAGLLELSENPLPQPLSFLVDDVARRFGRLQVGVASSYVLSEDADLLAGLLGDLDAASLRLHRIAPTVVVSQLPADLLLPKLRELGLAPTIAGPDGVIRVAAPDTIRARRPASWSGHSTASPLNPTLALAAAVGVQTEDARIQTQGVSPRTSSATTLAVLREAAEDALRVQVSLVDVDGAISDQILVPVRIDSGWLRAQLPHDDKVRPYALHRIRQARII